MAIRKSDPAPIYVQVKHDLQHAIASGQYGGDEALPDERTLAVRLGVSRVTVRRALSELESAGLIKRIPGRGTFANAPATAGEEPEIVSPPGVAQRTIMLLAPWDRADPREALFYYRMVQGIQSACPEQVTLSLQQLGATPHETLARLQRDSAIAGMIVMEIGDPATVAEIAQTRIPTVVCDCALPERLDVDVVMHANDAGGYAGVAALIELGHELISYIYFATSNDPATAVTYQISQQRRDGFERGMHSHGLAIRPEWVVPALPASSCGYTVARRLLSTTPRPTALFCGTDELAVGAMAAARDLGLSVPEQLSILGYGDLGLFTTPSLSAVRMEIEGSGRAAMQLLLERIANPLLPARQVVMPTQFIARASTGTVHVG